MQTWRAAITFLIRNFSFEEELMSCHVFPLIEEHRKMHADFIAELLAFSAAYKTGDGQLAGKIVEFLRDWTVTHILVEDKKYKTALKSYLGG